MGRGIRGDNKDPRVIIGWDIGGVNTKVAFLGLRKEKIEEAAIFSKYFEIWRDKQGLTPLLRQMALSQIQRGNSSAMAVTMTAELSDIFRTKREGVAFILNSLEEAFPGIPLYVFTVDGSFVSPREAKEDPLRVAAANWMATALLLAHRYRSGLLIDVGTTTTDIIPLLEGEVLARGKNDLERLIAGELVYSGVLRTPVSALVSKVPVGGRMCRVSSEYFAICGDIYIILGLISESDYVCPAPDGRGKDPRSARERLARVVCADVEMLSPEAVDQMATYIAERQVQQIAEAISQVLSALQESRISLKGGRQDLPAIVTGLGSFLARRSAERLGLKVIDLEKEWGRDCRLATPAFAVAHLLKNKIG